MPFDALFVRAELRAAVSDAAWLRRMLEAERALAVAGARVGVIPELEDDVFTPRGLDAEQLAEEGRRAGNPVEPLVRHLRERSEHVHRGATSQDILDTAAMLVTRDARRLVLSELDGVCTVCARLADEHRGTVMAGRTLLQQATPTTFGLKAATWLAGVAQARHRLSEVHLEAQLGGAAGTLAALGAHGVEVLEIYTRELGLATPTVPWHTTRFPVADVGAALALAAGSVAKIALDLALLSQTEIGEVREPTEGVSSTMPHKRNPVGATLTRACAAGAQAAATRLVTGVHELERAAGAWHAEWKALSDALALTGGAAAWVHETLAGLEVDVGRMRANIRADTLSEAERFGGAERPEDYLGSANELIDRALEAYGSG